MRSVRHTLSIVFAAGLLFAFASWAQAQATRTWVSGVGNDADPCSRTAPCKTFSGALIKTAAGGEISVLDPGGYGSVTINKAITINGMGQVSSIVSPLTTGITVNAGVNDEVTLKNIDINGIGTGTNGIRYIAGKALHLKNVWVGNFVSTGIEVNLTAAGQLFTDEVFINNCNAGIRTTTTSGFIFSNINRTQIIDMNSDGIRTQTGSRMTVRDSNISMNGGSGINVTGTAGNTGLNVENTVLDKNNIGLTMNSAGATTQISQVMITNNNTGLLVTAGDVVSFGNNRINGNAANGAPTSTPGEI